MTSSNSQTQAIALHFQNLVRVAGETIVGRVDLNLPQARKDHIEHLRIRVRGVIKTYVDSTILFNGASCNVHSEKSHLVPTALSNRPSPCVHL
jgi:hypothetical protein